MTPSTEYNGGQNVIVMVTRVVEYRCGAWSKKATRRKRTPDVPFAVASHVKRVVL